MGAGCPEDVRYTINISDVGKIKNAQISPSRMTILVGKNNTGKSYAATALWALSDCFVAFGRTNKESQLLPWFEDFFKRSWSDEEPCELVLNAQRILELKSYYNDFIQNIRADLFRSLFAFDGISKAANLSLESNSACEMVVTTAVRGQILPQGKNNKYFEVKAASRGGKEFDFQMPYEIGSDWVRRYLFFVFTNFAFFGTPRRSSTYIPAARTGLMLAFKAIVGDMLGNLGPDSRKNSKIKLSQPTASFLQSLVYVSSRAEPTKYEAVADWLEQNLIRGEINVREEEGLSSFYYKPKDAPELPMHAASSMITEIVPFITTLKTSFSIDQLIFEEPEAHLNLAAQRMLARALARLVNAGTRVVITTHSDTFLQQLNILMQLHLHPDRKKLMSKYGYQSEDLLDPEFVVGYEFKAEGSRRKTEVTQLQLVPEGLVVPSLNMTLQSLADEVFALQQEDE